MGGWVVGGLLIALAVYLAVRSVKEFKEGIASLKFKWTYPQIEVERSQDPVSFWLVTMAKLLIVGALAFFGACVVLVA